jgi:hypothetical protein
MVREAARAQRFSPDVVDGPPVWRRRSRGVYLLSNGTGWRKWRPGQACATARTCPHLGWIEREKMLAQ